MTKTLDKLLIVFAFGVAIVAFSIIAFQQPQPVQSSVISGGEYLSTSVVNATAGTSTLLLRYGSVGSIIVENPSSAAPFVLYDTASTTIATSSATVLLDFDPTAAEGTYQYDIRVTEGLMLDVGTDFDGDLVITYR